MRESIYLGISGKTSISLIGLPLGSTTPHTAPYCSPTSVWSLWFGTCYSPSSALSNSTAGDCGEGPTLQSFRDFSVMECLVLFSTISNRVVPFAEFYFGESYFLVVWDPSNASESVASVQGPQSLFLTAKNGVSLTVMQSTIGTWC